MTGWTSQTHDNNNNNKTATIKPNNNILLKDINRMFESLLGLWGPPPLGDR